MAGSRRGAGYAGRRGGTAEHACGLEVETDDLRIGNGAQRLAETGGGGGVEARKRDHSVNG